MIVIHGLSFISGLVLLLVAGYVYYQSKRPHNITLAADLKFVAIASFIIGALFAALALTTP